MIGLARRIADSRIFQAFIVVVILVNAVLVGLETSPELFAQHRALFDVLNGAIIAVFVAELTIRLVAYLPRPQRFFADGWNVFDFVIVALSLLPAGGSFATVARLARLLRVLRIVSVFPELRLIVGTMLRSVGSMGSVIVLLALVLYVYAVLGFHLFGAVDPAHWGDLGLSVRTLFEVLTLEGWLELQAAVPAGSAPRVAVLRQLRPPRRVHRGQPVHRGGPQQPREREGGAGGRGHGGRRRRGAPAAHRRPADGARQRRGAPPPARRGCD